MFFHRLWPIPLQKSVAVVQVANYSPTTYANWLQIPASQAVQHILRIGIGQNLPPVPGSQRCFPAILRKSPQQLSLPQVGSQVLQERQLVGEKVHSSPAASRLRPHPHRHGWRGYSV